MADIRAKYVGTTGAHFTNGKTYYVVTSDSTVLNMIDDNNQLFGISLSDINNASLWSILSITATTQIYP